RLSSLVLEEPARTSAAPGRASAPCPPVERAEASWNCSLTAGFMVFPSRGGRETAYRHRCRNGKNPLIVIERESALEVGLEFRRAAADIPRAIGRLRVEQELCALLIRRVGRLEHAGLGERPQRFAGGIGVASEVAIGRPSAV